jgi:hypothetical protein
MHEGVEPSRMIVDNTKRYCDALSEIAGADGDISLIMKASMRWVKTFRAFARGQRVGCDLRHLALSFE